LWINATGVVLALLALWRELAKNPLPAAPTGGRRPLGTS
jgi:hypothetical protein